jgi:hypothetical protein
MGTSQLARVNFKYEDTDAIEFFGARGTKISGGWAVNGANDGATWVQVLSTSIMGIVRECIADDIRSGNDDKIAMLLLAPHEAVVFFLEGKLTREHIDKAIEGADFVEFPGVMVEGRSLTVRVTESSDEYTIATADAEGNVL